MARLSHLALAAFVAATALAAARAIEEEEDVLVLDDDNFDQAIKDYAPLLVEFYAPWCGHCKRLAPEYAKAAGILKKDGHRIAKVDATVARDLASRFGIQGFPTLKFFPSATGAPMEYNGGRETDAIVSWVRRKSGPPTKPLASEADAAAFEASAGDVGFIGFFGAGSAAERAFNGVALSMDDVSFGVTDSDAVRAKYGVAPGVATVVAINNFQGQPNRVTFTGDATNAGAVTEFVEGNSLPLVIAFTQESAPRIFRGPIKTHYLLFADPDAPGYSKILDGFRNVAATAGAGKILFVTVDPSQDRVVSYFGVTKKDMPTAVIVSMPDGEQMKKFVVPKGTAMEEAPLKTFLSDYFAGSLKPFLKSDPVPADESTGPVTVVVGESFPRIALDPAKDVLLEFYAPWCGHCKQLAPEYDRLGARFKASGASNIVIAKIDATANEVEYPGVNVRGFPTILFFPASADGSPKRVVEYDGSRDTDGFVSFLQKNAVNKFTLKDDEDMEL